MTRIIEIVVSPDGRTKLETKGFAGSSCREASRFLELALGQRASEKLTEEFHQCQPAQHITQGENQT